MKDSRTTELLQELRDLAADVNPSEIIDHVSITRMGWTFDAQWLDAWHHEFDRITQAIAATLGDGKLTAEQVREAIERHAIPSLGCRWQFTDHSYEAIADELNADLGCGANDAPPMGTFQVSHDNGSTFSPPVKIQGEQDSHEKLEADALALVDNLRVYGCNYAGDAEVEIIGMLDRQASITRAELESGECKIIASSTDGLTTDNPKKWFELSCGHTFKIYGLDVPVACPVCGKAVKR